MIIWSHRIAKKKKKAERMNLIGDNINWKYMCLNDKNFSKHWYLMLLSKLLLGTNVFLINSLGEKNNKTTHKKDTQYL